MCKTVGSPGIEQVSCGPRSQGASVFMGGTWERQQARLAGEQANTANRGELAGLKRHRQGAGVQRESCSQALEEVLFKWKQRIKSGMPKGGAQGFVKRSRMELGLMEKGCLEEW